jgi:threonine dehydratase
VIGWALERDLERSFDAARETRLRIARYARHTPLVELESPGGVARAPPVRMLKLETVQPTGSFKIRGAASAVTVASLARSLGVRCRIFVPASAAPAKLARLRAAGVELVEEDGDPLRAELAARAYAERSRGALLVAPYNDPQVILGAATLGLELLEDLPEPPEVLFAAVGGGGLISGIALAVRARWPRCTIVGCLPEASPAMRDAVAAGRVVDSPVLPTLADATAGNIEEGSITVAICAALVDRFELISETEIAAAMRAALLEQHLLIEGAAALALAASLRSDDFGRHVVVLGGASVGEQTLRALL